MSKDIDLLFSYPSRKEMLFSYSNFISASGIQIIMGMPQEERNAQRVLQEMQIKK